MDTDQAERLILEIAKMTKQLSRIAEVNKMNLWYLMETQATTRQKGIISEVLKKL